MRTILAHLELSPALDSILACALLVGRRFDSYIEALHMRPGQPDVVAAGADGFVAAAPDLVAGFEREARERSERASERFEAFLQEHGIARSSECEPGTLCADWRIELAGGQTVIGSRGRVFDLLVVGRPIRDEVAPSVAALESALFESGRPVLVAPPEPPVSLGRNIVIAWNGSTETARTIAFADDLLQQAESVAVVSVARGSVPGPTAAELAACLRRRGIDADVRELDPADGIIGKAFLDEAAARGADLLIKGAYTQSRLRQMIFGGATSHILAHSELPVLMAN